MTAPVIQAFDGTFQTRQDGSELVYYSGPDLWSLGRMTKFCYVHAGSIVAAGMDPDYQTDVPDQSIDLEYRVDPNWARDNLTAGVVDPAAWPSWVFTSEREQARQVWVRLCYFAGLGVLKVFWFSNDVNPIGATDDAQRFYSYGLTDDTVNSRFDPSKCTGVGPAHTCADAACDPEACVTDVDAQWPYAYRRKKQGFCAMRQWNRFLDRYQRARLVTDLDGVALPGFYAVLFERDPESERYADYPLALVAWADAQGYAAPPAGLVEPDYVSHSLDFVRKGGCTRAPLVVKTIPDVECAADAGCYVTADTVCNPCLDDGEACPDGASADYRGGSVLRFGPDEEIAAGSPLIPEFTADPVLVLLPCLGTLSLDGGTPVEISDILSSEPVAGSCAGAAAEELIDDATVFGHVVC